MSKEQYLYNMVKRKMAYYDNECANGIKPENDEEYVIKRCFYLDDTDCYCNLFNEQTSPWGKDDVPIRCKKCVEIFGKEEIFEGTKVV